MLFLLSLLGFSTIFCTIYAIRAISDEKHKHNFKIYTFLASICAGISYWLILYSLFN